MTPLETEDQAAAYALDALDGDERAAFEAILAADAALAAHVAGLQATVALLADLDADGEGPPPADLGDRVLAAARRVRPAGRSDAVGRDAPATPADALGHSTAAFIDAVRAVGERGWAEPTALGLPVGDLVAHLTGAFDYVAGAVGASDEPVASGPDTQHRSYTQPAVEAARGVDRATVTERAAQSLGRLADWAAAADPATMARLVPYEGVDAPLFLPLVARAFEAWAHGEHLRRATGQPPATPPPGDLALLCDVAVAAMPVTFARVGRSGAGRTLRLVLVGAGGGTYTVTDGEAPPVAGTGPDASVVMEAIDLCRVTGGLVDVAHACLAVEGDRHFAEALIGSLAVLAE